MFSIILAAPEKFDASTFTQIEQNIGGFQFSGQSVSQLLNNPTANPVTIIFYAIGFMIVLNTVSAGIGYMTAAGDPGKVKAAQTKLTNSVLGLLLAFAAYWIVRLVGVLLGLQGITQTFG